MSDMTSAVAIDLLDNLIGMVDDNQENDYDSALHMAIDALKTQADADTVRRQDVINVIEHYCDNGCEIAEDNWCPDCQQSNFVKMIKALPPSPTPSGQAEPQIVHCKDCKSLLKWRSEEAAKKWGQSYECAQGVLLVPHPDDYCSHAKRKNGGAV